MKKQIIAVLTLFSILSACVTIPRETVTLSQTLGSDLVILHQSHRNMVDIHFNKIEGDVNAFVDDVYAPYIIHFVLKREMQKFKSGSSSLFGSIEKAGTDDNLQATEDAISVMKDFQEAARVQIEKKRTELMSPLLKQASEITKAIDQSYENAIYANSTVTGYLKSVRKVKEAQREALSMVGLSGADTLITNTLVEVSDRVSKAVLLGKKIDVMSDDAKNQLDEISKQIKEITQ